MPSPKPSWWERLTRSFAPKRSPVVSRTRNYDAAQGGRRTSGWNTNRADANAIIRSAGPVLREHARDLVRNNGNALRAQAVVCDNTVGWGITPRPLGPDAAQNKATLAKWKAWAVDSTEIDPERQMNFAGLLYQAVASIFTDGEVLFRRRARRPDDGLSVPLQVQVLEADLLDVGKDLETPTGEIVQGVQFDKVGRRVGYWIFPKHPGAARSIGESRFVSASEILHVRGPGRPGQVRGVSWLGAAIAPLKDLDAFEDAELLKQQIAACFAAFVTDMEGMGQPVGVEGEEDETGRIPEEFEPGMIVQLPPGKTVTAANPPTLTSDALPTRRARRIAATIGITYEDLTGDFSQVNFSSARMGRIAHMGRVRAWQHQMLIPQACAGVWSWFVQALAISSGGVPMGAEWTATPLPMIEPDKEILGLTRAVRGGFMTFSGALREQGIDPESHWAEYAEDLKRLDALKIVLDSDVRKVSQAGLTQERVGGAGGGEGDTPPKAESKAPAPKRAIPSGEDFEIDVQIPDSQE